MSLNQIEGLHIRTHYNPMTDRVQLLVRDGDSVGTVVQMKKKEEGFQVEPTLNISYEAAQILMDDLWMAGLRPKEGSGSAGSLKATEKHLSDMRKIVSKKIGVDFNEL